MRPNKKKNDYELDEEDVNPNLVETQTADRFILIGSVTRDKQSPRNVTR